MLFSKSRHQRGFPLFLLIFFTGCFAALSVYFGVRAGAQPGVDTNRPFATLTVTNTNDSGAGSLRQTVIDALPGDTIVFGGGVTGAITLSSGEILINKNLTIDGPGAAALAISGNNSSRIFNFGGAAVTVEGLTIRNGRSAGGAAMQALGTTLTFNDLVITNNVGTGDAGVMVTSAATLNINRSTISNNTALQISALYLSSSTTTITDSTFTGNSGNNGDVIRNEGSTSTLINTTISGNTSNNRTSGIRNNPAGGVSVLNLTNCTITNNTTANAGQRGAIWLEATGTNVVTIRNSIVSGNTSGGVPFDIEGTVSPSSSFNLIGTGGGLTNGVNSNIVGVNNPQLAPLGANGGATQTHALLGASSAIDQGSSFGSTTDQRGSPRPIDLPQPNAVGGDGADIGAFESQAGGQSTLTVTNTNDSGVGSLRQAVADAAPGDTIVFGGGVTGTIALTTAPIAFTKNVTINGPGANVLSVSGNLERRVFVMTGTLGITVVVNGLTITGGRGTGDGAGINTFVDLTLNDCVVSNNIATGNGGGIHNRGILTINRSSVSNNTAGQGGGIFNFAASPGAGRTTIVNTTVYGNTANLEAGGGIANIGFSGTAAAELSLTNATVAANVSPLTGGIHTEDFGAPAVTSIRNTIIANSSLPNLSRTGTAATFQSLGYNLTGDAGSGLLIGKGDIVNADPLLGPSSSGGNSTGVYTLLFGSPAIDKGSSFGSTTDQRGPGFGRPIDLTGIPNAAGGDGSDIGAFEAQTAPSGAAGNPQILFTSNRDGNTEVYKMDADGTNQTRLTNTPENEAGGYWSPNGQKILYGKTVSTNNIQIWTMNADGTGQTMISEATERNTSSIWSPDGQKVLFARGPTNITERIWVMNADGSNKAQLTNPPALDKSPAWSPDGTRIVFSRCNASFVCDVYTMFADGSNQINLTASNPNDDDNAVFTPDGSKLVFGGQTTPDDYNAFVMNADGTGRQALTNSAPPPSFATAGRTAMSPIGAVVALAFRDGVAVNGTDLEIYSVAANGTGLTNLTNNSVLELFGDWSPDGSKIAFMSRRDVAVNEIYTMNANGTGVVRLTNNNAIDTVTDWFTPPVGFCSTRNISIGSSEASSINGATCVIGADRTETFTFSGNANRQIAISMETSQFFSKIEFVNPSGAVIATVGGVNGVNNSRLPASGYFTLPVTGTYTIRAIAAFGGSGNYTISLYEAPVQACTYSLSPTRTDVQSSGGTFSFDVVTQPGCPPATAPSAAGTFYTNASYAGGRVTFTVPAFGGTTDRQEVMTVAGQSHTIFQYCTCPPTNDFVDNPNLITGINSPPNAPERGSNTNASAQNGEPAHAGNPASKSVWYAWTTPALSSGLYSFSTSGSSFDTVMAIYACPTPASGCTFANMTLVGSNDDTTFYDVTSKVNFRATAGTTYLIAIDGKNGASGTIELSWRQYQRLFRLYLQNYNGNQSPLVPDTVTASNGTNTVIPTLVSLGVYEFNLPADNTTYTVTITGPTGIVWDPNNFPLDSSFRYLDELMRGESPDGATGGQNTVSNAQNQTPRYIYGYIRNITQPELSGLSVIIGSSRGPNPREEFPCSPLGFQSIAAVPYATYQCLSQPNTLHDIVPNKAGKNFTISVLSFDVPITTQYNGTPGSSFIASNVPTYDLTGRVLAGGAGTRVDLTYTPTGNTQPISLRATTAADGSFAFLNLVANTYRLKATRTGFVFTDPDPVNLQSNQTVDITPESACSYTPGNITSIPVGGGLAQFTVTTNQPTCEWLAASDVPWITINSGAIVGNGPVHFTAQANTGAGRIGSVRIQGRTDPILVQQATTNPTFGTISGRVLTPNLTALRNAIVTIIDSTGNRQTTTTSSFGVYNFTNVQLGQIYTATVTSKRFRFSPKTIQFTASLSGIEFVGLE
ncbi:MAG TPA: choice-of-anchor Q domain-containing protein [Pyrinomonadaceae bacterium]|nr:choice-of-anchor Q domain-containing protein [Pyrinomonadaceae bacterium]